MCECIAVTISTCVAKEVLGGKVNACLCELAPFAIAALLEQEQLEAAALR